MSHPLYAVLTFTCTFVLLIFMNQFRVILDKKEKSDREFFTLSNWVTFFCLQDSFWGLCSIGLIQNHFVFFISSTIFHATAAISACIWLSYILNFIGLRRRKVLVAEIIAIMLVLFQFVLLTRNFETKYIFDISPEGEYITQPGRNLLFYSQLFTFLIIAGLTAQKFFSEKHKSTKRHYLSGLLFIFAPVICATLQETFPFAPCYSIGFMLGSCTIYAFVISEMSQERFLSQRAVIVAGLSSDYDLVMFVDITKNQANFFQVSPKFSKLLETEDPKLPDNLKFDNLMRRIINPSELNDFIETTYRDHCLTILKDAPSHMIPFTANINGQTEHYRLKIASNSSNANSFVVGVICFEEEHRLEEKAQILKKNLQHTMLIASRDAVTGVGSAAAFKSKCDQLDKQIKSNHARYLRARQGRRIPQELLQGVLQRFPAQPRIPNRRRRIRDCPAELGFRRQSRTFRATENVRHRQAEQPPPKYFVCGRHVRLRPSNRQKFQGSSQACRRAHVHQQGPDETGEIRKNPESFDSGLDSNSR